MTRRPPGISVLIALHDSPAVEANVRALSEQSVPGSNLEIVIADGWHDPGASAAARRAVAAVRDEVDVRILDLPPGGRAAAWNRALEASGAPLVLLLADDFVPVPGLLGAHLGLHARRPEPNVAGVGPGRFPEPLRADPFVRWLEDEGRLFGVSFTRPEPRVLRGFFYGANASLKRPFLEAVGPFDEAFPFHGWDDFELGERAFAAGMEVEYLPDALAWHHHAVTLRDRASILRESGRSAAVYERSHAGPHPWDAVTRRAAWRWTAAVLRRRLRRVVRGPAAAPALYQATLDAAMARGHRAERRVTAGRRAP